MADVVLLGERPGGLDDPEEEDDEEREHDGELDEGLPRSGGPLSAPRFHCSVAEVMHGTTTFPSLRAVLGVGAPAAFSGPRDERGH